MIGEEQRRGIYPGWIVVALSFMIICLGTGPVYYAYGNYSLAFATEFHASRTTINLGYTMVVVIGSLGSAPVGWLLHKWPVKVVALIGVFGTASGMALVSLTTAMWQAVVLFGTLIALSDICLNSVVTNFLVSHWFERRRGLAIACSVLGASAGAIIFPPVTSGLIQAFGWRTTFVIFAVTIALLALPVARYARVPDRVPDFEAVARDEGIGEQQSFRFLQMWGFPPFWIIAATIGIMMGVNTGTLISLVPYAKTLGFGPAAGALLVSSVGIGALVGKVTFGAVADRIDLKWALRTALLLLCIGQLVFAARGPYPALVVGALASGLALGGMLPVWGLVTARVFGLPSYGKALGATRLMMTPLSFFCPMLAGFSFDRFGNYQVAWFIFASLAFMAFAITFAAANWASPLKLPLGGSTTPAP